MERSQAFFDRADCNVDVVVVQNQNETIHKNLAIIPKMASPRPTAPTQPTLFTMLRLFQNIHNHMNLSNLDVLVVIVH